MGGPGKTTVVSSSEGVNIVCNNQTSFTVHQYAVSISNSVCFLQNDAAPNSYTGKGFAGNCSLCFDHANGNLYITIGNSSSPVWKMFTRTQ